MRQLLLGLVATLALSAQAADNPWHLALAGDTMLGSTYPTDRRAPHAGRGLLDVASPILRKADIAIGNLEGTIGTGGSSGKSCTPCFAFRSPPEVATTLAASGFALWSQANNHAHDFGTQGLSQTREQLSRAGMTGTGPANWPMARRVINGRSICLLAYAPNMGMRDLRNVGAMQQDVGQARKACNLIVVSFHGGAEGSNRSHTPKGTELYLGENRGDVRAFSHAAIDAGAGLVFGHGPHIVRGMELYRGHLVAYSLGNFMAYGGISTSGDLGASTVLDVRLKPDGALIDGTIHSFRQTGRGPLRVDRAKRAGQLIQERTKTDFGGGLLAFGSNGSFGPK
jgi:poly-gamma-glutamate capsule biosynthesis protein CapA/YwtB (metallophosphatase superfamily)